MRLRIFGVVTLVVLAVFVGVMPAAAQIQASERGVTSQTIDGTTITLDYSRPVARGRTLFGALVPWNGVWLPGANWATTLEVNKDIRLNGVPVPAGTYSVWAIPRPDRFTITLNPATELFHFQKPDSTSEQIHISAEVQEAPHAEMLTWSFPAVSGDAGTLQFQWGTTAVAMQILVEPSQSVVLAEEQSAAFVGEYDMQFTPGMGWPSEGRMRVFTEDGVLRVQLPFPIHPDDEVWIDLIPAGGNRFNPGLYRGDVLFNVEIGVIFEFSMDMDTDRATALSMVGAEGSLFAEGARAREEDEPDADKR